MANIIAIVWDFDKTLVNGYMQAPIFRDYGVDSKTFWDESNDLPDQYWETQRVKVNPETIYLNHFIKYAKDGRFKGLNNDRLKEYGAQLDFYPGVPEIFDLTKRLIEENPTYAKHDIKVEHYIVSTGMLKVIEGSSVADHVEHIWGCEFIEEEDSEGNRVISEVGFTIDNTTKTRALFEINKGVHYYEDTEFDVDVNTSIPEEFRRVQFRNMVYIADGPSDIPAFSLMKKNNGEVLAVYPTGSAEGLKRVEKMRMSGRIGMYAEADYSEGTTACLWLCEKISQYADRIVKEEREKLQQNFHPAPSHSA